MESGSIGVAETVVLSTSGVTITGFCFALASLTLPTASESLTDLLSSVSLSAIGMVSGYITFASVFHGVRNLVRVEGTKR